MLGKKPDFNKWRSRYYFSSISIDELNGKVKYFPNKLRSLLIRKIFEIYKYKKIEQQSLIYTTLLNSCENSYLVFLMENRKYNNAYINYLKELVTLVIVLIEMIIENRVKSDKFIHQNYEFSFSPSTIANIKKEVKNLYYYSNL